MKPLRIILICSEILFALLLVFPPVTESRSFARAIVAYDKEPTLENQKQLSLQKTAVWRRRVIESVVIPGLLVSNSVGLFFVFRHPGSHEKALV